MFIEFLITIKSVRLVIFRLQIKAHVGYYDDSRFCLLGLGVISKSFMPLLNITKIEKTITVQFLFLFTLYFTDGRVKYRIGLDPYSSKDLFSFKKKS